MRKGKKAKIVHKITDKYGTSKQYPKVMTNPKAFGFSWNSSYSMEFYLGKKK